MRHLLVKFIFGSNRTGTTRFTFGRRRQHHKQIAFIFLLFFLCVHPRCILSKWNQAHKHFCDNVTRHADTRRLCASRACMSEPHNTTCTMQSTYLSGTVGFKFCLARLLRTRSYVWWDIWCDKYLSYIKHQNVHMHIQNRWTDEHSGQNFNVIKTSNFLRIRSASLDCKRSAWEQTTSRRSWLTWPLLSPPLAAPLSMITITNPITTAPLLHHWVTVTPQLPFDVITCAKSLKNGSKNAPVPEPSSISPSSLASFSECLHWFLCDEPRLLPWREAMSRRYCAYTYVHFLPCKCVYICACVHVCLNNNLTSCEPAPLLLEPGAVSSPGYGEWRQSSF